MAFLYETHMHTCQGSACGTSTGKEHVRAYKDKGYTGIIITDHFFRGNCAVDRSLPWKKRIELYCSGYEDALIEGQKIGLDVFFGIEENHHGDEYLIYGLDKKFLLDHPEMEHWTRKQQYEEVHKAGGCVVQAHPFRFRGYYMDKIRLGGRFIDGCEVANAGNNPWNDARALRWGREMGFSLTAGSDNHKSPNDNLYGVVLEERLTDIHDFVKVILEKKPIGLYVPEERFMINETTPAEKDLEPAYDLNECEEEVPASKNWLYDTEL